MRAFSKIMKAMCLPLVLSASVSVASAQVAEKEVKLIGVTSGLDKEAAIIEVRIPRKSPEDMILSAGQAMNGVQVLKIEAAGGTVNLKVDGEARTLTLEEDPDHPSTHKVDQSSSPLIRFRALPLQHAINLYAHYADRTMMRHPQLGNPTFSLDVSPHSKEEAAAFFQKMFNERNIATIPDGEHLLMVIPFAFTNALNPRAVTLSSTNALIPEGSVNFLNAPVDLVLSAYADYVHKEIVNLHDSGLNPRLTFTFVQTTPLSREELCYALETQIEWRNVRIAPDGNGKFKFERIPESK